MRLAAWVEATAAQFQEAGIGSPLRDARLLVQIGSRLTAADLVADPDRHLGPAEIATLADLRRRRLLREPVSRIAGRRGFMDLDLEISPATLDPRPDTETLVEAVIETLREEGRDRLPLTIADLGTGSGAILIALLQALPKAIGTGIDISGGALAVAARNAEVHGVAGRASWRQGSWLDGLDTTFDVIASNPPYIPTGDIAGLEPEVRSFDPIGALDGGPDGLDAYRCITGRYGHCLAPGGWLFLEVGAGQATAVAALLGVAPPGVTDRECYASDIRFYDDLMGHSRCVAKKHHYRP